MFKPRGNSAHRIFGDGEDRKGNVMTQIHELDKEILLEGHGGTVSGSLVGLLTSTGISTHEGSCISIHTVTHLSRDGASSKINSRLSQ